MAKSGLSKAIEALIEEAESEGAWPAIYELKNGLGTTDLVAEADGEWQDNSYSVTRPHDDRHDALTAISRVLTKQLLSQLHNLAIFRFGSPIEETFFYGLVFACWRANYGVRVVNRAIGPVLDLSIDNPYDFIDVTPQAAVGGMRPDLLLSGEFYAGIARHQEGEPEMTRSTLAIECDGHDFHEKTKAQASRDKRRDRELASAGAPVVRFTGSEIFRDPLKHATWAIQHVRELAFRPVWEARFRRDWEAELAWIDEREFARKTIATDTGFSLDEWAKRLGKKLPGGTDGKA